ncbi:aminoglycoside 6-adenylyltransferase [Levilactobacillus spicheri]|uniref:Aminoglycoside 6-adenylyltransferase n=1 Tax=Levilactobacillus spicheri TaxID=216463 RepID=A0A0F3RW29_9LACO|nr:aminoglycoside 6-adenylyltransferase [Levilactobacillus spicheri]KJW13784.1 hypothetical protein VC81_00960 [Levilactobacillus spicheri]
MTDDLTTILKYAQNHDFIQAVGTEGSTNDAHAIDDSWQDLDVTYFVSDADPFNFYDWAQGLGVPTIYQHSSHLNLFHTPSSDWQTYLVQFANNARVDLKIAPIGDITAYLANDSLNKIIWSRDAAFPERATDDHTHRQNAPTQEQFNAVLNEFYWCIGNVGKGLARGQFLYANEMNNQHVRPQLLQLLTWSVASGRPEGFNPGAYDKYLLEALPKNIVVKLARTYRTDSLKHLKSCVMIEGTLTIWAQQQIVQKTHLAIPQYLSNRLRQLDDWINRL